MHQVHDPGPDRLDHDLRALAFEEAEHVEVAVAFGSLREELARHFDDGLHAQAVDLDLGEPLAGGLERVGVFPAEELIEEFAYVLGGVAYRQILQEAAHLAFERKLAVVLEDVLQVIHALFHHGVSLAGVDFVRADLIADVVDQVAHVQRVEDGQEEIDVHLKPGFGLRLVQAARLLEEHDAESVEARIAQRQPVLRLVHPEAARPAGARREEDMVVNDLLARLALLLQSLQELHQIPDREVGWITLAVIAVLLAGLKSRHVRNRKSLALIPQAFERPVNQLLVLPGETAEEQYGIFTLTFREWVFDRSFEVLTGLRLDPHLARQPASLLFELLPDQLFLRHDINQTAGCGRRS